MCDCIAKTNRELRSRNTAIAVEQTYIEGEGLVVVLPIPTRKIIKSDKRPVVHLMAAFCPMCGESMSPPQNEGSPK